LRLRVGARNTGRSRFAVREERGQYSRVQASPSIGKIAQAQENKAFASTQGNSLRERKAAPKQASFSGESVLRAAPRFA
jgi:hypothetical protein